MSKSDRIGVVALGLGLVAGLLVAVAGLHLHELAFSVETYVLPIFFVYVGVELRHEFTSGYFVKRSHIVAPALGAIGGVLGAAALYIAVAGSAGWTVPTATDITLGLAALALFGSKLRLKARFLALATIDDLIGLGIILILFTADINVWNLAIALASLIALFFTQLLPTNWSRAFLLLGPLALIFSAEAGVQTSVVGFVIGLALRDTLLIRSLPVINNYFVLPVFGFAVMAGSIVLPIEAFAPAIFAGVLLRPIGKLFGIVLGGALGDLLTGSRKQLQDWLGIGLLGGIGLTVSFLLSELSFDDPSQKMSAIAGTLAATILSVATFSLFAGYRARQVAK